MASACRKRPSSYNRSFRTFEDNVRFVGTVARAGFGDLHRRDIADFIVITDGDALIDAPFAIAARPGVEIAAACGDLFDDVAHFDADVGRDIAFAGGAVAI